MNWPDTYSAEYLTNPTHVERECNGCGSLTTVCFWTLLCEPCEEVARLMEE